MSLTLHTPTRLPVTPHLRLVRSFPAMPAQVYPPECLLPDAPRCADCGKRFLLEGSNGGRTSMRAPRCCRQCRNVGTANSRQDRWT